MALSGKQFRDALDGLAKGTPESVDIDNFFKRMKQKGATAKELSKFESILLKDPRFVALRSVPGNAEKLAGAAARAAKPAVTAGAGIRGRLAALGKGAKNLVRTPTFGGLAAVGGLGFLASAALSDQKERQMRGIQRGLVNPALGQNILSGVDLESQMGTTRRLNTMASLMEAGQAMTPQEAELSAILGAAGAAAAQNAAVGRNLDEVALDNVLRMT